MTAAQRSRVSAGTEDAADQEDTNAESYVRVDRKASGLTFNQARTLFLKRVHQDKLLTTTAVLVALLIAEHFDYRQFQLTGKLVAYPSHSILAELARISERQVQTHTKALVERDLFDAKKGGAGRANEYTAVLTDRKCASGLTNEEADSDRKSSVVRPEVQRSQTGSQLPSNTTPSSAAGAPTARPALSDSASKTEEETRRFGPDGPARVSYRVGQEIDHPTYGLCTVVSSMKRHRHVWTKRGGKGNPNETHPVLFERNNSSGQESPLTGTPASFDRNSRVVLTGTEVPPIYMEDSDKEIHSSGGGPSARPPSSGASATSSTLDAAGGEAHRLSADAEPRASPERSKVRIGDVLSLYDQWKDEISVGCVVTEIIEDGLYGTVRTQDGSGRTMFIGDDDGPPVLVAD